MVLAVPLLTLATKGSARKKKKAGKYLLCCSKRFTELMLSVTKSDVKESFSIFYFLSLALCRINMTLDTLISCPRQLL